MSVVVALAHGDQGQSRQRGIEERLGRRGSAAVVGDFEQVKVGEVMVQQVRIHILLRVARQEERPAVHRPKEHHGDVIDLHTARGRPLRDGTGVWPEHLQDEVVDRDPVAGP
jgi:hypothetical protein